MLLPTCCTAPDGMLPESDGGAVCRGGSDGIAVIEQELAPLQHG
jgi:hypothetical protein